MKLRWLKKEVNGYSEMVLQQYIKVIETTDLETGKVINSVYEWLDVPIETLPKD